MVCVECSDYYWHTVQSIPTGGTLSCTKIAIGGVVAQGMCRICWVSATSPNRYHHTCTIPYLIAGQLRWPNGD